LPVDAYVVVRRRIRYVDGLINNRNDTYYPRDLVDGTPIALPGDVVPGAFAVLEGLGAGWRPPARDNVFARAATIAEAALFGVPPGEPMLEIVRTRMDADRRPVAVSIIVGPGSRFECEYEVVESNEESIDDPDSAR